MPPLVHMSPAERDRVLSRLIASGGVILPDALYTPAEVARLIGRDKRTVRRLLEDADCPLTAGLHDAGGLRGRLIRGSAVLAYQDSIRVRS